MSDVEQFEEWVEESYRRLVADAESDGIKRAEVVEAVIAEIEHDIAEGDLEVPPNVIAALVRRIIEHRDDQRRARQATRLDDFLAALDGETLLGDKDPILDEICVIGNGMRKAWRYVGIEDLMEMASTKTAMAADAAVAANEFMSKVRKLVGHLQRTYGAGAVLGDLAS